MNICHAYLDVGEVARPVRNAPQRGRATVSEEPLRNMFSLKQVAGCGRLTTAVHGRQRECIIMPIRSQLQEVRSSFCRRPGLDAENPWCS